MSTNSKLNAADFTESYYAETEEGTFMIHVRPGTDLDSTFTCLEEDSGEFMRVSGWMASYTLCKEQPRATKVTK